MPTPTYVPLASLTLTATDSEIVFSSIPATYRDLILICSVSGLTGTPTVADAFIRINADSTSIYSVVQMRNAGSSIISNATSGTSLANVVMDPGVGVNILQFLDYSATDKHKTVLIRSSTSGATVGAAAGRVALTAAIHTITLTSPDTGTDLFNIGSTFSLYGVN